jgi:MFS family permease
VREREAETAPAERPPIPEGPRRARLVPASLTPLRDRRFARLFSATAGSVVGDNLVPVAIAFAVLQLTGSASALGLVFAARTVPLVAVVLAGGVWADRLPRTRLMITSDLVRAGSQALFGALLLSGHARIWELVVLQAVHGTATAFFQPAVTGLVPQTVPPAYLQEANALLYLANSVGIIAGPALAGIVVAGWGPGWAFVVDAATFLVSAAFLAGIDVAAVRAADATRSFLRELAAGFAEVRSRRWLWSSVTYFALVQFVFAGPFYVLGPLISARMLGGAGAWATILTAYGVGAVVGGLVVLHAHPSRPLVAAYAPLLAIAGANTLLATVGNLPLVAVAELLAGASVGVSTTLWETTLQTNVPADRLSRVSAYDWMGSTALRPVGFIVVGPVTALLSARSTLLLSSAIVAAATISIVALPAVHGLRPMEPEPAAEGGPDA